MDSSKTITIIDDNSDFNISLDIPGDTNPYTIDLIKDYIIKNKDETIFKYDSYWKYTFDLKTKPFTLNGITFIMTCIYGGLPNDIYKFNPDTCTLHGDNPDCIRIHKI